MLLGHSYFALILNIGIIFHRLLLLSSIAFFDISNLIRDIMGRASKSEHVEASINDRIESTLEEIHKKVSFCLSMNKFRSKKPRLRTTRSTKP